ncbi:MAG: type II toxin-antitoxin system Phd/YefM family antitoxin [Rhodothermales bacterium]
MATLETTYTEARAKLATFWNKAVEDRETIIIHRRGHESVALIPLSELSGLMETAHLLRSPRNAERLLAALAQARAGEGETVSLESLREAVEVDNG